MKSIIKKDYILCSACGLKFDRTKEYKFCSNCFACTGCEIYYCPQCDNEIVITPVKQMNSDPKPEKKSGRVRKVRKMS